jgi:hypothetical protein
MPAPADQMLLQLRAMHADELRKRVSNSHLMPKAVRQNLWWPIAQAATTMQSTRQEVKR